MNTQINTLYLENAFNQVSQSQEYHCKDAKGTVLLILIEEDVKRMYLADLEPSNDDDLFTYANHLLGGRFTAYSIQHVEA